MDVVYPIRRGARNEQLRYSLRSLANLPHDKVWIVGGLPPWLKDVGNITMREAGSKWVNIPAALLAACEHPEVSDPFVYFNDDFFVMHPVEEVPVLHRGSLREHAARNGFGYSLTLRETLEFLESRGFEEPLSYELHIPMTVRKKGMEAAIKAPGVPHRLQSRSLYGNLNHIGGEETQDVKCGMKRKFSKDWPFVSSASSFQSSDVGGYVRNRFPKPSPYEK